jgi:hypothetical protein
MVPVAGKLGAEYAGNESSRQHAMGIPDFEEGPTGIPFIDVAKLKSSMAPAYRYPLRQHKYLHEERPTVHTQIRDQIIVTSTHRCVMRHPMDAILRGCCERCRRRKEQGNHGDCGDFDDNGDLRKPGCNTGGGNHERSFTGRMVNPLVAWPNRSGLAAERNAVRCDRSSGVADDAFKTPLFRRYRSC